MGLLKAFWLTLRHLGKYRWMTIEFKDGSILVGAATQEIWSDFTSIIKELK